MLIFHVCQKMHISTLPEGILSSSQVAHATPSLTTVDLSRKDSITGLQGLLTTGINVSLPVAITGLSDIISGSLYKRFPPGLSNYL